MDLQVFVLCRELSPLYFLLLLDHDFVLLGSFEATLVEGLVVTLFVAVLDIELLGHRSSLLRRHPLTLDVFCVPRRKLEVANSAIQLLVHFGHLTKCLVHWIVKS